jgi:ribosomal protein L4
MKHNKTEQNGTEQNRTEQNAPPMRRKGKIIHGFQNENNVQKNEL